ncbi:LppP/LprE family lipoprotein [Corynebacterium sphenisci]|uniref:LppP/LprE family lipoprotein n=1 Tax=Corynebacterium sphenisci TaxID=191493 RepID=UPI0026DF0BDB|nr:LppP/LprE family lipoprotein [Corynebacterium sphenisci]MDO5731752.1 LppP/LprE family lipoprotein [Corynebacterium sphenisci]
MHGTARPSPHRPTGPGPRRGRIAFAAIAAAALLAGCGGPGPDSDAGAGDRGAATAGTAAPTGGDRGADRPDPTAGAGDRGGATRTTITTTTAPRTDGAAGGDGIVACAGTAAEAVAAHIDSVDPPPAGERWAFDGESNYEICGPLTYALLVQRPQGNAQFATRLMFFHHGRYLGVDTLNPQQAMHVAGDGEVVQVRYKDWRALAESGEPHVAAPTHHQDVEYRWDGAKVAHRGTIPDN